LPEQRIEVDTGPDDVFHQLASFDRGPTLIEPSSQDYTSISGASWRACARRSIASTLILVLKDEATITGRNKLGGECRPDAVVGSIFGTSQPGRLTKPCEVRPQFDAAPADRLPVKIGNQSAGGVRLRVRTVGLLTESVCAFAIVHRAPVRFEDFETADSSSAPRGTWPVALCRLHGTT